MLQNSLKLSSLLYCSRLDCHSSACSPDTTLARRAYGTHSADGPQAALLLLQLESRRERSTWKRQPQQRRPARTTSRRPSQACSQLAAGSSPRTAVPSRVAPRRLCAQSQNGGTSALRTSCGLQRRPRRAACRRRLAFPDAEAAGLLQQPSLKAIHTSACRLHVWCASQKCVQALPSGLGETRASSRFLRAYTRAKPTQYLERGSGAATGVSRTRRRRRG